MTVVLARLSLSAGPGYLNGNILKATDMSTADVGFGCHPPPLNLLLVILLVCLFACVRVCVRVLCALSAAGSVLALLFLCIIRHLAVKWADGGLNHGCPPR